MSILIVGGDFLGDIVDNLIEHGATEVTHWDGRARGTVNKVIPARTDLVVVMTDYVSHKLCNLIKSKCRKTGCAIVFSKRSWSHLNGVLERYGKCKDCLMLKPKKKLTIY